MFETACGCIGRHDLLYTFVNLFGMVTLSCSWQEARRIHRQQPSLDHRDETMLAINHEGVLMDAVVRVAKRAMTLQLQWKFRRTERKGPELTGVMELHAKPRRARRSR